MKANFTVGSHSVIQAGQGPLGSINPASQSSTTMRSECHHTSHKPG